MCFFFFSGNVSFHFSWVKTKEIIYPAWKFLGWNLWIQCPYYFCEVLNHLSHCFSCLLRFQLVYVRPFDSILLPLDTLICFTPFPFVFQFRTFLFSYLQVCWGFSSAALSFLKWQLRAFFISVFVYLFPAFSFDSFLWFAYHH